MSLSTIADFKIARAGRKVVFTNGVFDLLHAGHVTYLQQAKGLGEMLVVGLNSDESVRLLGKGDNRPYNTLEDRAVVLAGLSCVDMVISFDEQTPENLLEAIRPEVHVKGGDYTENQLPEAKIIRKYGGQIVILPLLPGRSSTSFAQKSGWEK